MMGRRSNSWNLPQIPISRRTLDEVSSVLNIRVSDIQRYYHEWKSKGAEFLTEPKSHQYEFRCYIKDPDGYLIEVGQTRAELLKKTA
jgi:hypothetical protein